MSNWKAQTRHDPKNTVEIWGAFGYTPDKEVVRAPMTASTLPWSVDQLTWEGARNTLSAVTRLWILTLEPERQKNQRIVTGKRIL